MIDPRTWNGTIAVITITFALALVAGPAAAQGPTPYEAWGEYITTGPITAGAPQEEAQSAFRRIESLDLYATGPGSWVFEMSVPARVHHRRAEELEVAGDDEAARAEYRIAAAYYDSARWPCLCTPERRHAYQQHLACYQKYVRYSDFPLEVVSIPFENKHIIGHLHKPTASRPPIVVWSGGIDGWKTSGIDIKQQFLDAGFAVFAMDLPGTGESQWPLDANCDRVYSAVFDHLKQRPDLDGDNIGVYFGSFSGVFAIKLALTDPDVKASVNHSGGIHLFFHPPVTELPPLFTSIGMRAFATINAMRMNDATVPDILAKLGEMSLQDQGLLKPTPDQAPLLSIYGDQDDLMPIQDLEVLKSSGVETEALVYAGDGHMAWNNAEDHQPKMMAFFKKHLMQSPDTE